MRVTSIMVLLAVGMSPALLPAQQWSSMAQVRLMRCAQGVNVACLQARVTLDATAAAAVGALDSADESRAWTGSLRGQPLMGPAVSLVNRIEPPLRLLVLLDRSGSMLSGGMAFVRIAIANNLLSQLDSGSVRVAVAGFESHGVAKEIFAVDFVTPSAARTVLNGLLKPDPNANTGLYTAVVEANRRLKRALAESPGAQGAILLVTDGENQVYPGRGDDPELLIGEDGLRQAIAEADAPKQRTWVLGVGKTLDLKVLSQIAGVSARFSVAELDPVSIGRQLTAIVRQFRGARTLTFGVPGSAAMEMARTSGDVAAALWVADRAVVTEHLAWRPPFFALPAYEGVVDSAALPVALRAPVTDGSPGDTLRWAIAALFGLLGVMLATLVPRLIWIRTAEADEIQPVEPANSKVKSVAVQAKAEPAAASGGLRRDVTEAAPRTSVDITQEVPRLR